MEQLVKSVMSVSDYTDLKYTDNVSFPMSWTKNNVFIVSVVAAFTGKLGKFKGTAKTNTLLIPNNKYNLEASYGS